MTSTPDEELPRGSSSSAPQAECVGLSIALRWDDPASLRGEIYSAEHLELHAADIARAHGAPSMLVGPGPLLPRFRAARARIREAYAALTREAASKRDPSPAQEWLLDNSHVVADQLREIEEDLPAGYLALLPRISKGPMARHPRVYGLCLDYLRHTDSRVDIESLARYVLAYQSVRTLTIGELWAVPIMLRLGLILSVGAIAASEGRGEDRARGDEWAERLLSPGQRNSHGSVELERLADDEAPVTAPFLVQLLKRLREYEAPLVFGWIREQAAKLGLSSEELARRQHLRQAGDQVSVGNAITSMRAIGALDWNEFFERTSAVEAILRKDPANAYTKTDKASRDRYRHAIEDIARRSGGDESGVAKAAIALCESAPDSARTHVGYYLVDAGRRELERKVGYRVRASDRVLRAVLDHPAAFYLGSIGLITFAQLATVARGAARPSPGWGVGVSVAIALLALLPASEVAITIVNVVVTSLLPPRLLAKLDFRKGVPTECRTLVAVPAMLDSVAGIRRLLADLEVRSLANPDEHLHFALITDFTDHAEENHENDDALLEIAKTGIADLNRSYRDGQRARYFLFHRRRLHNAAQGCWMGWERKRGKLEELNRLLRGATDTTFSVSTAPTDLLPSIRYVLTLDADTELPRETARRLVATIAHPLNRAELDPKTGRVVSGYGVIQPRIGVEPVSARRSRYARIMAGQAGIDPYTTAVSDVYQDLFEEGSYVGKAIYDIDAFSTALHGRVPDDRLLSHDLFEGVHARTALATDIELYDGQTASYAVAAGREHRWIRGDWQLLAWLWLYVPGRDGQRRRNDLSIVARWKLFDNLRRSLIAPALIALLMIGWFSAPRLAALATAALVAVLATPLVSRLAVAVARPSEDRAPSILTALGTDIGASVQQMALGVAFLLDHTLIVGDAVLRTLYRTFVSQKHLLEWQPTGQAERRLASRGRPPMDRRLWAGAALAFLLALAMMSWSPRMLPFAAPLLFAWAIAPFLASWISKPLPPRDRAKPLSPSDRRLLRVLARKTWHFFEVFVTAADHFLPPDNYQEEPRGVVAHRTSPTNIGLYLLSIVAARDFGFVTLANLKDRLGATLSTIERLERREGHILNWYETTTLKPLDPQYVSTVDSGNLAAYLWTIRVACEELCTTPIVGTPVLEAALDALSLFEDEPSERCEALHAAIERARTRVSEDLPRALDALAELVLEASALVSSSKKETRDSKSDAGGLWLDRGRRGLVDAVEELCALAPWAKRLLDVPSALTSGETRTHWEDLFHHLTRARTPAAIVAATTDAEDRVAAVTRALESASDLGLDADARREGVEFLDELRAELRASHDATAALIEDLGRLGARAAAIADAMSFTFLYDEERALFSIGYNVGSARLDGSHYDLLASEARLASLIAIAKGDVPQEHWFRMGRPRAGLSSGRVLMSWSGSMFEYLMPLLVTKTYEATLLDETYDSAVLAQRECGRKNGVPWGISESAFNTMDLSMTYQYRAFGVPQLGLKSGLDEDLVVAPYATVLASLIRPDLAVENLRALKHEGLEGPYGYYESIDYTPKHLPPNKRSVVVKTFMAHHQGMSLVALDNVLQGSPMQRRFHRDPRIKASELLLEERVPVGTPLVEIRPVSAPAPAVSESELNLVEHVGLAAKGSQRVHLLGHGDLSTIVSAVGTGVTTWKGMDVHRFREDSVLEPSGIFLYVRDLSTGEFWSGGFQPTRRKPDRYDAAFSADRVEIHRRDGDIETVTEIGVSPEYPAEMRRVTITNYGKTPREIELTTYAEVVLAPRGADLAHRAFSDMFVETEALPDRGAVFARRRPRASNEAEAWMVQVLTPEENDWQKLEFDCSRFRFIGRGRSVESPLALIENGTLAAKSGALLDPALVLRRRVLLEPGKKARIALATALASSREEALALADTYGAPPSIARTFELGWADARVELRHLGVTGAQAERFQRLLSALLSPNAALRAMLEPAAIRGGKDALWAHGISGDLPILILRADDDEFSELCREVLVAHEFWRVNGVAVDIVILNEEPGGYLQPRQQLILSLVGSSPAQGHIDQRGGVFVRRADQIPNDSRTLLLHAARVVLVSSKGSLARQLRSVDAEIRALPPAFKAPREPKEPAAKAKAATTLLFENGIGGFSEDGREYVIRIGPDVHTPAPWCNVIASASFGCLVSETGSMCTWSQNSQSHRLSPWSNDPVSDPSGEAIYLRDDEDGSVWSATPMPAGGLQSYEVRHGQGYTVFEHTRGSLSHALRVSVDPTDPVKISRLRLHNKGKKPRTLSLIGVVEWVLGTNRDKTQTTVVTDRDTTSGAVLAWNPFSAFPERCAFFTATRRAKSVTADRRELFGRNGSRARPAAMDRAALSGLTGVALDPCAALQLPVVLAPGESVDIAFVLGEGRDKEHARELAKAYGEITRVESSIQAGIQSWDALLETVTIKTPDAALDLMVNRWLPYQVTSSRLWGRTAFYQSGGAYGFRDQLQDILALLHTRPDLAREHILRAAARQFGAGDVQHWWHPNTGEGVRTRCSDDMLWLPYVTAEYVRATGDAAILDESVPFLEERALRDGEPDLFSAPASSRDPASLYEHCTRALDAGTTGGAHGLPLMRAGDWNDGMNRVGAGEKGESVWLAWFLAKTLRDFNPLAIARGDTARVARSSAEIERLRSAVEEAWDGEWYRRAYFDDGTPLGSKENAECSIDAIAQSWAVLSGIADPSRALSAIRASERMLVRERDAMLLLFWPPFAHAGVDPGYIGAYPAGVRENGGQYTHGCLWTVLAAATLGEGDRAAALLGLINPIHHSNTPEAAARYAVEPYVLAADVYAASGQIGRGGWTWYTGSAAWMLRIALENMLGIQLSKGSLVFAPCIPSAWRRYEITYRHKTSALHIVVENPHGVSTGPCRVELDGKLVSDGEIKLLDDGLVHEVRVVLRAADAALAVDSKSPSLGARPSM